jgi:hypothetical protein
MIVLGSKIMSKSLVLFMNTHGSGIPQRKNMLIIIWISGYLLFRLGFKVITLSKNELELEIKENVNI